jgi:probable HAF family extracellular repeat protein
VAQAVNNDGVVVGASQTDQMASNSQPINHAFVWTRRTRMEDIGTDGLESFGEKVSGRFVIGQTFTKDGEKHGFAWTRQMGFVDIGTLGGDRSFAAAVNDSGVVVGNSSNKAGIARAFMWSASSGIMVELESRDGMSLASAIAKNFIVGTSCDDAKDLNCHATLWKPAPHSRKDRDDDDED